MAPWGRASAAKGRASRPGGRTALRLRPGWLCGRWGALWLPRLSRNEADQETIRGIVSPTNTVAGAQGWQQNRLNMGPEYLTVDRSVDAPESVRR